jgi:DNA invertase Pin-like site-specific DNA recombinase
MPDTRMYAILYAAKSTPDEKGSIESQLKAIRKAVEDERRTIVGEFSDENASAYHGNRGPGLAAAIERAKERAPAELWCFDPDRLARGDGKEARHLAELFWEARQADVTLRAVNGDSDLQDPLYATIRGERNHKDSEAKAAATKRAIRESVAQGNHRSPHRGYVTRYEHNDVGKIKRRWLEKDPETEHVIDLILQLALEGKSDRAIELECDRRGFMTSPRRKDHRPQPFNIHAIRAILNQPFYAGLQIYDGELHAGNWPTYITPEEWQAIQARRKSAPQRKAGRSAASNYLLRQLLTCRCGAPAHVRTGRKRKDGTRAQHYVCYAHRSHHRDSEQWCPELPWDARQVDQLALASIEHLLGDTAALREQMDAGQRAEREKLERTAKSAQEDVAKAEKAAERATDEFADAEDPDERAMLKDAATRKRKAAADARVLADAALDALNTEPEHDPEEAMARLWATLSSELTEANGDVELMREALRTRFRFKIEHGPHGPCLYPQSHGTALLQAADAPWAVVWGPTITVPTSASASARSDSSHAAVPAPTT